MGDFERNGASRQLVVLLHAFRSSPARLRHVCAVVRAEMPDADLLIPALPLRTFSIARAGTAVTGLIGRIDRLGPSGSGTTARAMTRSS